MKNWKIGTRISIGFGAIIAVSMALGIFAATLVGGIQRNSEEVTGKALPGLYLVAQIQNAVQKNFSSILTLLTIEDPRAAAQLEAEILNSRSQNTGNITEYEKTIITEKGREMFNNVKAARSVYSTAFEEVLKLKRDGKEKEAYAAVDSHLRPAHAKYVEATSSLMALRKSFADEKGKTIDEAVSTTRTGIEIGLALALLLGASIAWTIVRSISRPLATAGSLIASVSRGDLSCAAEAESKDEFGQMIDSMNRMVEGLRGAANVATEISEGNLSCEPRALSEKDLLGQSLIGMVKNLRRVAEIATLHCRR
ncbi:MAG: MCP four helix bundle domain-containing protein [Ignavibacteriota bacterium]